MTNVGAGTVEDSRTFRICTIVTDWTQYEAMRGSFVAAGFGSAACEFISYDNTSGNKHDPFRLISSFRTIRPDRFVILCHQDVRLDRGTGLSELAQRLAELTKIDENWAVAGNFGFTSMREAIGIVNDPHGTSHPGVLPKRVLSLDENFLVFRPDCRVRCTPDLSGFHLYATDICLNAYITGMSAYVIDFELTHLSGGNPYSSEFGLAARKVSEAWNAHFLWAVVETPCTTLRMSRFAFIRQLLFSAKVVAVLNRLQITLVPWPRWLKYLDVTNLPS